MVIISPHDSSYRAELFLSEAGPMTSPGSGEIQSKIGQGSLKIILKLLTSIKLITKLISPFFQKEFFQTPTNYSK